MTTHAVAQLETIYHKPLSQLSEGQIVTALKAWDDEDNFLPIVELVDALASDQLTPTILSEQARACNNLYWANKTDDHKSYLHRAVAIFKSLEPLMGNDKGWNYKIGYAYFYLDDKPNAKKHLSISADYNNEHNLLHWIERATTKGISTLDAENGGAGGVEYELEDLIALLSKKAPKLLESFNPPASRTELAIFEHKMGVKLPESFWQFYRTFNGQQFGANFAEGQFGRFLNLEEILLTQEQLMTKLQQDYGDNWQTVRLDPSAHSDDHEIKNRLYHPLWLPISTNDDDSQGEIGLLCLDLDPNHSGQVGQVISLIYDTQTTFEQLYFENWSLKDTLQDINALLRADELVYDPISKKLITPPPPQDTTEHRYQTTESATLKAYIEHTFGQIDGVINDDDPDGLACPIVVIKPTAQTPYYTLITHGMGAYTMNTPDNDTPAHGELLIRVPPNWQLDSDDAKDSWVIDWLRTLAKHPLTHNSYFASGHTIPTGGAIVGTKFECFLLLEADDKDYDIACVKLPSEKVVVFYQVIPLYKQELQYKLDAGNMALMKRLEEAGIPYPPVVDTHRPNVCLGHQPHTHELSLFDGVFWSFNARYYESVDSFGDELFAYNARLDNPLDGFDPNVVLFDTPILYVLYHAQIQSPDDLYDHEFLEDPEQFHTAPLDSVPIIATITGTQGITALTLLWQLHNSLANKTLGEHVFFEGLDKVGIVSDDDTDVPVIEVRLGS